MEDQKLRCQFSFSEVHIAKILQETSQSDILTFLAEWASTCNADEKFSLDITSISSYGKNNEDIMPGYNWDREKLPPINLLMVVSQKTKVPVWFDNFPVPSATLRHLEIR